MISGPPRLTSPATALPYPTTTITTTTATSTHHSPSSCLDLGLLRSRGYRWEFKPGEWFVSPTL
ncbi:uncharacterized protein BDCG_16155 [Blastomyces dermatitidis ER-3]|uniref:Uncharacterized protein n=1 Tax=Ajellomyces dermatitidis (strain ER-3 / ATCC MYA-2586) TaxID=559297 RepID=A0ABX2VQE4_AJEDR|nr:uncharacterized protein BDCG_16155 [Blastomyces dermatitidis ER-3]OAS99473.1 hypothetical protein BDCG_16155 [Blastomyces dermatitidis ER-3]